MISERPNGNDSLAGARQAFSTIVADPREDEHGLELLIWTCRCHGNLYSDPACCLHTDQLNLIPPRTVKRPNASNSAAAKP